MQVRGSVLFCSGTGSFIRLEYSKKATLKSQNNNKNSNILLVNYACDALA